MEGCSLSAKNSGYFGSVLLALALMDNIKQRTLCIDDNNIRLNGAKEIEKTRKQNKMIQILGISDD